MDADHAGNQITRQSHSGVLLFIGCAPIIWYSKQQNMVNMFSFGSEFKVTKTATEMILALQYNLCMMGIPIDGPTNMFCDNKAVVRNSTMPESTLKKKYVAICYHCVQEVCALDMFQIAKEGGATNLADVLTKSLQCPQLRDLIGQILY